MIENKELNIQPDFQRLFQWSEGARSRFIESLLLEMPIPPIYVVEDEENKYLLIDGLQRISSYLHFRGRLDAPDMDIAKGQQLTLTECDIVPSFNGLTFDDLPTALQIRLKRYFVRVEVVRYGSDAHYKYYMFKRLNTGGVSLSEQQIRNCTIRLLNPKFNDFIKELTKYPAYRNTIQNITEEQSKKWYDEELILRFFALKNWREGFSHEVGDYLTEYMERVADTDSPRHLKFDYEAEVAVFKRTFDMLDKSLGSLAFSRANSKGIDLVEGFGIYHFEAISIGCQSLVQARGDDIEPIVGQLAAVLRGIKLSPEFIGFTKGGGKNSKGLLDQRISHVRQKIAESFEIL